MSKMVEDDGETLEMRFNEYKEIFCDQRHTS